VIPLEFPQVYVLIRNEYNKSGIITTVAGVYQNEEHARADKERKTQTEKERTPAYGVRYVEYEVEVHDLIPPWARTDIDTYNSRYQK
jgi:hypothetical protein